MGAKLKANVRRELRRSLSSERGLLQKFKHSEVKVHETWRRFMITKKKERVLRRHVKEEVKRVARQLKKLNLGISAYSVKSRQWASMIRAERAVPHSKRISTMLHGVKHRSAQRFQAKLKVARDEVVKIANKLKNVIKKSQRLRDARARVTHVYKRKLTLYFLQLRRLENKKTKLEKMYNVFSARFVKQGSLGRKRAAERKTFKGAASHEKTIMLRKIHNLKSREGKLYVRVKKETGRYVNKMIILNKNTRMLAKLKRRMIHKLEWKIKKSQMELVRRSNRLNVQIALENRLVRHAWRASKFEEAHLAKQVDIERRKRRQEVVQLRHRRETLQSEVRHHRSGVPNKSFHENNKHLKHLTIAVERGAEKFAKQRIMMARRLAAEARRVAQKSVGSMERERRWRRQLTAVAQWESRQVHSRHNREWHLRSGEKKYQHIIRELRAKIQVQKGSHARKSKTLLKKEVMRVEGKILRELRQFRAKEASRRRELKNFKLRMQEISQRLLKAHVKAKFVLSSLKAEKMKGEARLLHAINSAREKGISAHTRARWSSKPNKYKNERAQLYRKIIEQNADLAKKLRLGRKSFAKAQRVLAEEVREVKREKVLKHVRVRSKQYFVHLKEEKAEMLKVERRNKVFIRKLAEQKSKTLEKLQREREEHAIKEGRLHQENIAFEKEFENNERDIVMLKRMKKRLLKVVMGERLKSEKYVAHARSAQVTFHSHVIHRRGLSEALKIMKARLWKMEKESKKERLKTKIAGERAAILKKRKVESIGWSRRVQKIHNVLLAELRRRELERARLMVRRRILHDDFVKTHLARRAISRKIRRIRSLEHILEKMKGRGRTYYEAARRMRKKAVVEISRIKLAKLNVVRKLRRVQKRMQDKLRELHSGKYKTMKSLRKLEEWRGVKSQVGNDSPGGRNRI